MDNILIQNFGITCKKLLDITTKLVEGPNKTSDKFSRVMEGICRRNYFKLHSIMVLYPDEFTGDAIMDLSRGMIEDMICVEFMKLKGKDNMADKFLDYSNIEQKIDMDFLLENKSEVDEQLLQKTNEDFERVKDKFMRKPGEISRSWASCDIEHMISELLKNNILSDFDRNMLLQAYIIGNRKNHLSSIDTLSYISDDFREHMKNTSKETGLLFSLVSYIKVADEFACQIQKEEVSNDLKSILLELNQNGFKKK